MTDRITKEKRAELRERSLRRIADGGGVGFVEVGCALMLSLLDELDALEAELAMANHLIKLGLPVATASGVPSTVPETGRSGVCSDCDKCFEVWPPFHYWYTRGGSRLICQGSPR